jgi:hypothetical protein
MKSCFVRIIILIFSPAIQRRNPKVFTTFPGPVFMKCIIRAPDRAGLDQKVQSLDYFDLEALLLHGKTIDKMIPGVLTLV